MDVNNLDFHDETIVSIKIVPSACSAIGATLELILNRHWENKIRRVSFSDCSNVSLNADMDVLFDNAPCNTSSFSVVNDASLIQKVMRNQKKYWNVSYGRNMSPLNVKINSAEDYCIFHINFFGATLLVVAKEILVNCASPDDC